MGRSLRTQIWYGINFGPETPFESWIDLVDQFIIEKYDIEKVEPVSEDDNEEKYREWQEYRDKFSTKKERFLNGVDTIYHGHCDYPQIGLTHEDVYYRKYSGPVSIPFEDFDDPRIPEKQKDDIIRVATDLGVDIDEEKFQWYATSYWR